MKVAIRLFIILLVPMIAAVTTALYLKNNLFSPASDGAEQVKLFEIASGASFKQICRNLEEQGFIRHAWSVDVLARLSQKDRKIRAGEYELSPTMTPKQVLGRLLSGEVFKRKVLVTEGTSVWQIGKIVEEAGLVKAEEFNRALRDPNLLSMAGLQDSFEGYLFPETYFFSRPIEPKEIIWRMIEEGDKHWPVQFTSRAESLGYTRHEIITLASIIQKESGNVDEQPTISSVFQNRLSRGMKLESDPTVIYDIENFNGNLTHEDLHRDSPHNTYTRLGIPPGPICNPGESAIRAALFPAQSEYIFFVGNGKGSHAFAVTLKDHNDNVRKYQLQGSGAPDPAASPSAPTVETSPSPAATPDKRAKHR